MDVTGSRLNQMNMLVSKEDQHINSQCDKQMKVQCNENYQRPSWLKGNTKSSNWPVPKTEKDYSCADKENVDPRIPCKNIFNNQKQVSLGTYRGTRYFKIHGIPTLMFHQ